MDNFLLVALVIAVAVIVFLAYRLLFSQKTIEPQKDDRSFLLIHNQMIDLANRMDKIPEMIQKQSNESARIIETQHDKSSRMISDINDKSSRLISDITEKLTQVTEGNRKVIDIADQLRGLEDILTHPKQRGILGEYFLEETLKNVLPPNSYEMQYKFKNGEIVDAVIFIKEKIVPIDSKFSLENYERILSEKDSSTREAFEQQFKLDLKKRIDETSKYIRPNENTMDFAFMFIPSEAIYYDLLVNKIGAVKVNTRDLIEYAFKEKHVIIVSPTSFLAYLQTVLQGLRALQIEESAKEIKKRVEDLGRHLSAYEEFMKKLGNNLGTAVGSYNFAYKELGKIDKDVLRISGEAVGIDQLLVDKPNIE